MIFISLHHHFILHAWTIRSRIASAYLKRFVSSILHQYVDFASSRSTIIQSRWFLSCLLIFEVVEKSMSSKIKNTMLMRSNRSDNEIRRWLDQKKKSFVTNEDLDSQRNLDESRNEESVNKWIKKFLFNELNFSFKLNKQQLAIHSLVSQ
jgi:hypothetical protein